MHRKPHAPPRRRVIGIARTREEPSPAPIPSSTGQLAHQCLRQRQIPSALLHFAKMPPSHAVDLITQLLLQYRRQNAPPILTTLPAPHDQAATREIHVLDS